MKRANRIFKAAVVIAIALAFLLPGAAIAGNTNTIHIKNTQSPAPTRDSGWVEQASGFYEESTGIRYLDSIDENVTWAVGYDGSGGGVYKTWFTKTSNGGELWEADTVLSDENYGLGNICGIDSDTAWAALFYAGNQNDNCGIYNTSDGGNSWNHQEGPLQGSASFANNVFFWDENIGMCQGDLRDGYFEVYTTNNGGVEWTRVPEVNFSGDPPVSGEAGWTGVIDIIGDTATFGTNKGNIWKSDDRGHTWTVSITGIGPGGLNEGVNEIAFKDENYGLAAHDNGMSYDLYVTSNGGDDWEQITPAGFVYAAGLSYVPGTDNMFVSTGAASGSSGASYSVDGGHTWVDYSEMMGIQMLSCDFVEGGIGWAGAFNEDELTGGMWKYTPEDPEPVLAYDPTSHDFGDMLEGQTDSTTFEIWNSGTGTLEYTLSESCGWVDVNPTSGDSTGEHDTITVDIDTTGLSVGSHSCDISITSNGGSSIFMVTVNIVEEPEPAFAVSFTDDDGLTITIANVGTAAATNVAYDITIEGGFIILPAKEFTDSFDSIESGESESVALGLKGIGLGIITSMPKATVNVTCDEGASAEKSKEFKLFLSKVTLQ